MPSENGRQQDLQPLPIASPERGGGSEGTGRVVSSENYVLLPERDPEEGIWLHLEGGAVCEAD